MRIDITKMVRLAILATLLLLAMGCRSMSSGELLDEYPAACAHMRAWNRIDQEFVSCVRADLHTAGWTFRRDVRLPIVGHVGGYYNPFLDHITICGVLADSSEVVVHEMLHRAWFKNMTIEERLAFSKTIDAFLEIPNRELCDTAALFQRSILSTLHGLHPLNKIAWYAEAYSYIGEMVVSEGWRKTIPLNILCHYENFLVKANPNYSPPSLAEDAEVSTEVVTKAFSDN